MNISSPNLNKNLNPSANTIAAYQAANTAIIAANSALTVYENALLADANAAAQVSNS